MVISGKSKVCLVSCSVLKDELQCLVREGRLDAELVFVSKYFHVDYEEVEKNLRKVLEATLKRFTGKIVVVYGDLCLGQNGEMKKLTDAYGVAKVDAANCVDCQLGGGGKFFEVDPEHNLLFMGPGMIEFFKGMKEKMLRQGVDEAAFAGMFSGIKGIVLLDTCGNAKKCLEELQASGLGLPILEVKAVGLENVLRVVDEAINKSNDQT
ncbi:MAG: DUF1638 domain-containing protein [Candidatus Bathyarchaeia archaeon]